MKRRLKVLLVDSDGMMANAVKHALGVTQEFEYMGCCLTPDDVKNLAIAVQPDVALLEYRLAARRWTSTGARRLFQSGLSVVSLLRDLSPSARIIGFSTFDGLPEIATKFLDLGAVSIVSKEAGNQATDWGDWLRAEIRAAAALPLRLTRVSAESDSPQDFAFLKREGIRSFVIVCRSGGSEARCELGRVDCQILQGFARGLPTTEIARRLCLADGCIRVTEVRLLNLLGLGSNQHTLLADQARRWRENDCPDN